MIHQGIGIPQSTTKQTMGFNQIYELQFIGTKANENYNLLLSKNILVCKINKLQLLMTLY